MFGLVFVISSLTFLLLAAKARGEDGSWIWAWIMVLISASLLFVGIKIFRNGFPRRNKPTAGSN